MSASATSWPICSHACCRSVWRGCESPRWWIPTRGVPLTFVDRLAAPFSAHARLRVGLHLIERGKAGKGLRHMARAARRQCMEAQYRLGRCYLEGRAVPPSRIEAMRWLEQAAQRGHAQAQFLVAALYAQGVGYETGASSTIASLFADATDVDPDYEAALMWARRAAQ